MKKSFLGSIAASALTAITMAVPTFGGIAHATDVYNSNVYLGRQSINTVYTYKPSGGHCTVQYEFGNVYGAAYSKIRVVQADAGWNCDYTTNVVAGGYRFDGPLYRCNGIGLPSSWNQATVYNDSVVVAEFWVWSHPMHPGSTACFGSNNGPDYFSVSAF